MTDFDSIFEEEFAFRNDGKEPTKTRAEKTIEAAEREHLGIRDEKVELREKDKRNITQEIQKLVKTQRKLKNARGSGRAAKEANARVAQRRKQVKLRIEQLRLELEELRMEVEGEDTTAQMEKQIKESMNSEAAAGEKSMLSGVDEDIEKAMADMGNSLGF